MLLLLAMKQREPRHLYMYTEIVEQQLCCKQAQKKRSFVLLTLDTPRSFRCFLQLPKHLRRMSLLFRFWSLLFRFWSLSQFGSIYDIPWQLRLKQFDFERFFWVVMFRVDFTEKETLPWDDAESFVIKLAEAAGLEEQLSTRVDLYVCVCVCVCACVSW